MNKISQIERWVKITAMAGALLYAHGGKAEAQYVQTNLVSNIAGLATVTVRAADSKKLSPKATSSVT